MSNIKTYREIWGRRKVKSLRFMGNFEEVEEFVGGDAELRKGVLVVASTQGPLKVKDGQHIIKHPEGLLQVMDYTTLRQDYEMVDR